MNTGPVGLAVCDRPHERLRRLDTKLRDGLEQTRRSAAYRKYTEQVTSQKLSVVKVESGIKKLQDQLWDGQIEELILQAEEDLSLARQMMQWQQGELRAQDPPANLRKWQDNHHYVMLID
nr:NADH dehydrogenase [ubiquinone] 1 alpha subcomplex subunit 5-like [Oryctolagus cuniculus]